MIELSREDVLNLIERLEDALWEIKVHSAEYHHRTPDEVVSDMEEARDKLKKLVEV